eukprot:4987841-Pleurochrysis_carterae.AAC.1
MSLRVGACVGTRARARARVDACVRVTRTPSVFELSRVSVQARPSFCVKAPVRLAVVERAQHVLAHASAQGGRAALAHRVPIACGRTHTHAHARTRTHMHARAIMNREARHNLAQMSP